jgi:hypothetical protein
VSTRLDNLRRELAEEMDSLGGPNAKNVLALNTQINALVKLRRKLAVG